MNIKKTNREVEKKRNLGVEKKFTLPHQVISNFVGSVNPHKKNAIVY